MKNESKGSRYNIFDASLVGVSIFLAATQAGVIETGHKPRYVPPECTPPWHVERGLDPKSISDSSFQLDGSVNYDLKKVRQHVTFNKAKYIAYKTPGLANPEVCPTGENTISVYGWNMDM